jgi:hypothetical protein
MIVHFIDVPYLDSPSSQLVAGIVLVIGGAIISLTKDWKSKTEQGHKKINRFAIVAFISAFVGAWLTYSSGRSAIVGKIKSDSAAWVKDSLNEVAKDSIISLNREITKLAVEQLDTSKTILRYSEKLNMAYQDISNLQSQLNTYFVGDNVIPWITTMTSFDRLTFTMLNTGKNPMWNVKVKCQEQQLPDIGVLPTRLIYRYYTALVPKETKNALFDFVIWYNNGKSVLVDVYISRRPDGFLNQDSVVYSDRNGVRFEHPLIKHKPKSYWNYKTPGYKPDQSY